MKEGNAVQVFDLVRKSGALPAKIDELVPLSFIGAAAVKFYKAKVEAMKQLGIAEGQRAATLRDGQDAGECLLRIEARIGELLPSPEQAVRGEGSGRGEGGGKGKAKVLPDKIKPRQAQNARAIHRHPEAVERVIAEARENEDIPTKTAVLKEIQLERERDSRSIVKAKNKFMMPAHERAQIAKWGSIYLTIKAMEALSGMTPGGSRNVLDVISRIRDELDRIEREVRSER